jgi:Bacterial Ig-like domain (group 2)
VPLEFLRGITRSFGRGLQQAVAVIAFLGLTACGGGGGGGASHQSPQAPTLVSITVTPANSSVVRGATQQLTATGTYTDGSKQDITSSVTWTSSDAVMASISATGLAEGLGQGPTTIQASLGAVSGSTAFTVLAAEPLQVADVTFLEEGGRPLHEGSFPIQSDSPVSGATHVLRAHIFGNVASATLQLVSNATKVTLVQGPLPRMPPADTLSSTYVVGVIIPAEPFIVAISATGIDGKTLSWQSPVFNPSAFALQLAPATAVLTKGQTVPIKLLLRSASASGSHQVSLQLPPGFVGPTGPWAVSLTPGATAAVDTSITAPTAGQTASIYVITAQAFPTVTPSMVQNAKLEFLVQ